MSRLDSPQGESHTHSSSLVRRGDLNLVPWAAVDNYVKQSEAKQCYREGDHSAIPPQATAGENTHRYTGVGPSLVN